MSAPGASTAGEPGHGGAGPGRSRFADITVRGEVGSTNDEVAARARAGAGDGIVVVADHQTRGRGRRGRTWESPPGTGLLASVLLRPAPPVPVPVAAGLAVVDACRAVAGVAVSLKWPNDVVVPAAGEPGAYRKLGGILAEVVDGGAVVVGLGLNLVWTDGYERPEGAAGLGDLVADRAGPDRDAVLRAWLDALETRLAQPVAGLLDHYRAACVTLGRRVRVVMPSTGHPARSMEGLATDIDPAGRLVVDGTAIDAGDVTHLRNAPM